MIFSAMFERFHSRDDLSQAAGRVSFYVILHKLTTTRNSVVVSIHRRRRRWGGGGSGGGG